MNNGQSSDELWDLLADFRQAVLDRMQPGLAALGGLDLTLAQGQALQHVAVAGPLSIAQLQKRLARAQASTSQLVTQLERRGLVVRRADPVDRRRTIVALSARGRRQMSRLETIRRQGFADVLGELPPGVQRQLRDALEATVTALATARSREGVGHNTRSQP
jgi:DNA-binding MarR family transcriptional regulator